MIALVLQSAPKKDFAIAKVREGAAVRREMSSGAPQKILKLNSIKYASKNFTPPTLVSTAH